MRSFIALTLFSASASAQVIYSWEDGEGVHYTDDASQVPKAHRSLQKKVMEAGPESSGLVSNTTPSPAAAPAAPTSGVAPQQPKEREWRDRFIAAYRHIDTLKRSIGALEASLPPPTTCAPLPRTRVETTPAANGSLGEPLQVTAASPFTRCLGNPVFEKIRIQIVQQGVEPKDAELDLEELECQAVMEAGPR